MDENLLRKHAEADYRHAMAIERRLRREWEAAGKPLTYTYANGITAPHPLLRALNQAVLTAARLRRELWRRPRGRPPVAVGEPLDGVI
jgi:hypothetical protein